MDTQITTLRSITQMILDTHETVVALAMLVQRFNFELSPNAPPVEMTTGATIHTTQGLKMTVTRRRQPPIIPSLEVKTMTVGEAQHPLGSSCPAVITTKTDSETYLQQRKQPVEGD